MKTILDLEKEFDEIFGKDQYGGIEPFRQDKVKEFISTSLRTLLEQVVVEKWPENRLVNGRSAEWGWNDCCQEVEEKIKKILK